MHIVVMISRSFLKLVIIANFIALPISYVLIDRWLESFAYRTDLEIWMFVLSTGLAVGVALLTMIYQAFKAATANPVDILRYQ